jgi:hypothetical protein
MIRRATVEVLASAIMHILLSQMRESPNLEGQVPVIISSRNRVAHFYPQSLGFLSVASYDSQGYGGGKSQSHIATDGLSVSKSWCRWGS